MAGRAKKPVASSSPVLASKAVAPRKSTNSRRIGINSWWDNLSSMNADELRELYMLDYHVGSLAEYRAGFDNDKFYVPDPLTILLYGPSGSGKSSLINSLVTLVDDREQLQVIQPTLPTDETGRPSCTTVTTAVCLGTHRSKALGSVELWDTKGMFHCDDVRQDVHNCVQFMFGQVSLGDLPAHKGPHETAFKASLDMKPLRPVKSVARSVDLIVFVVDPNVARDVKHLITLAGELRYLNVPYRIVFTKADEYPIPWSNFTPNERIKLTHVPQGFILGVENYIENDYVRSRSQDRNLLFVLMKLIVAAEESLLISKQKVNLHRQEPLEIAPRPPAIPNAVAAGIYLFVAFILFTAMIVLAGR